MNWGPATALLVVDLQNDFAMPNGSLYVRGGEDVVPIANRLIAATAPEGAVVVYSKDWHPEQTPHFSAYGGVWPEHCRRDTWGAELVSGLARVGTAVVVHKGTGG